MLVTLFLVGYVLAAILAYTLATLVDPESPALNRVIVATAWPLVSLGGVLLAIFKREVKK